MTLNETVSELTGTDFDFANVDGNVLSGDSLVRTGINFGQNNDYWYYRVVVLCDVNGDGTVTEDDAVLAEKIAANEATADSVYNIIAADVDASLTIDENDAALIRTAIGSEKKLSELYDKAERIIKKNYPNLCHARPFDFSRVPEYSSVE